MRTSSRPARARRRYHSCGDGAEVRARLLADDDPGVVGHAHYPGQHGLGGGCEGDHAGAGLAVAEAELACGAVHVVPAQREDLVQAAAGEHEEAERRDGVGGDRAVHARLCVRLRLRQHRFPSAGTPRGEEALALLLPVLADGAAGVGAVGHQAPGGGEGEHLGEDHEGAVGGAGRVAQAVVQGLDVGALDHAERHHAEGGEDVVLQRAPVDAGGVGVAVLCDVGGHVALCEVGDGHGAGLGRGHGGVLAALDAVDDLGGAEPRLRCGDLAVGAEGDAARAAAGAALHDVDLAAGGIDADAEAGELAVPDDDVARGRGERVHRPSRQRHRATPRHRRHVPRPNIP